MTKTEFDHVPVLLDEIIQQSLEVADDLKQPLSWVLDLTFGRGGHTRALVHRHPVARFLVGDRDPQAIEAASQFRQQLTDPERLVFQKKAFSDWVGQDGRLDTGLAGESISQNQGFDFILLDLGVSSPQLDQPERGFSFYSEGPLDMRMDPTDGPSAADVLMTLDASELVRIFVELGDIPRPQKVVQRVIESRQIGGLRSTHAFAQLIEKADGWRVKGFHPATQYFMALRMYVNRELEHIRAVLPACLTALRPGGRLAVISFHSHEDRMVKSLFRKIDDCRGRVCEINSGSHSVLFRGESVRRKAFQPTEAEVRLNPRARSAKLRVMRKYEDGEQPRHKNKYRSLEGEEE